MWMSSKYVNIETRLSQYHFIYQGLRYVMLILFVEYKISFIRHQILILVLSLLNCVFLSCHIDVLEWIYTL